MFILVDSVFIMILTALLDAYYYLYFEMDKAELPGIRSLPR
jgi:hypothetical protein